MLDQSRSTGQRFSRQRLRHETRRQVTRRCQRASLTLAALLVCLDASAAVDCTISTIGVAFGVYDPLSVLPTDSTGELNIECVYLSGGALQIGYSVHLSPGSGGTVLQQQMAAAPSVLRYNLFTDAARSAIWGDGSAGTTGAIGSVTVGPGVGNGRRVDARSIYGRIPAQQDVLSGNYADSIIVTLVF